MPVSKPIAVLVLLASLLPVAYLVFFLAAFAAALLSGPGGDGPVPFRVLFVLHALCIVWIWGLLAFYLAFLFKSPAVPKDQKVLWAVVLFLMNALAMPVFWYLYVWPQAAGPVPEGKCAEPVAAADDGGV